MFKIATRLCIGVIVFSAFNLITTKGQSSSSELVSRIGLISDAKTGIETFLDLALYDDFNDPTYDGSYNPNLWYFEGSDFYDVMQDNGAMVFSNSTSPGPGSGVLTIRQPGLRTIEQIQEFEADLKISSDYSGGFASVLIQILIDDINGHGWWTQCTLHGSDNSVQPFFVCDVFTFNETDLFLEYKTTGIALSYDTWYTAKIEVDPQTAQFNYYLNGNLVGSYIPNDASGLLTASNLEPRISVWNDASDTYATRYIDNVSITYATLPTPTPVLIDDFNDNSTDTSLWWTYANDTGPSIAEINQRVEISLPGESYGERFGAGYSSAFNLRGDFDVEVEYSLLNWPVQSGVRVGMRATNSNDWGQVERTGWGFDDGIPGSPKEVYLVNFNWDVQGITPTADHTGKLRLRRRGNVLTGYYFDSGTGNWVFLHSAIINTDDVQIHLDTWSHDSAFSDSDVLIAFDDFVIYEGEIVYPLSHDPRPWTIMYYQAWDNDLDGSPINIEINTLRNASNNSNIYIPVFRDYQNQSSVYEAYVDGQMVANIPQTELNTGDSATLSDFINWSKSNFPADHYAIIIVDHGNGLSGTSQDITDKDWLDPQDFQTALQTSGPFDVVFLEACLSANLEHAYQARNETMFYVASEAQMVAPLNHQYLNQISSSTSARDLAEAMAVAYNDQYNRDGQSRTISVGDMSKIEQVAQSTNAFSSAIRSHRVDLGIAIWGIITGNIVQRFEMNDDDIIDENDILADLYHFAQLIGWLGESDLTTAANNLITAIDEYIVYNSAWSQGPWDHDNAYGLSIILTQVPACYYTSDWFDFAGDVSWFCDQDSQMIEQENGEWGQMLSDLILDNNPDPQQQFDAPPLIPLDIQNNIYLPLLTK